MELQSDDFLDGIVGLEEATFDSGFEDGLKQGVTEGTSEGAELG